MRRGFTLIELLIVVAIIAILAAIAVPNFLEAQTRAKVSRTKSDMRSLVTALEAYVVDNNEYPPLIDPNTSANWVPRAQGYSYLTTPIAYVTSVFPDVFNTSEAAPAGFTEADQRVIIYWAPDFLVEYNGINLRSRTAHIFQEFTDISDGTELKREPLWAMISYSPDQDFDVLDAEPASTKISWYNAIQQYDPTNGTISDGDVVRLRE